MAALKIWDGSQWVIIAGSQADLSNHISNDGTDHSLLTAIAGTAEASKALIINASKNIAGLGTIGSGAIASSGRITFNTSIDSARVGGEISLGEYQPGSPFTTRLAISQGQEVVGDTDETKFSYKLPVRINGVTYNIMLTNT